MFGFIPVIILLSAAIAVVVLNFVPRGPGIAWLVAILASVIAWIITLLFKNRLPFNLSFHSLDSLGAAYLFPFLQIDIISWPIAFMICAVTISLLIVSSARIGRDADCWEWAGILLLGALGYLASQTGNLLTVILLIGIFDIVDIGFLSFSGKTNEEFSFNITNSVWHFVSLILLILSLAWNSSLPDVSDDWKSIQPGPMYLILASCVIRMVMLPINKVTGSPRETKEGLYISRICMDMCITLSVLFRLSVPTNNTAIKSGFLLYLLGISIFAIIVLLIGKTSSNAIVLKIVFACLIMSEFLYGFSASGILLLICSIGIFLVLVLQYPVNTFSKIVGVLALASFSGLPFTPNNTGYSGFAVKGQIPGIIFLIPATLLFYYSIKKTLKKENFENPEGERWTVYLSPTGLIFPIISSWIILLLWMPGLFRLNIVIQPIIVTVAGLVIFFFERMNLFNFESGIAFGKTLYLKLLEKSQFSRFSFFSGFQNKLSLPISTINNLLEGDGGILWAILCLVLVITILQSLGLS